MKKIEAFLLGMREFRLDCTTSYKDWDLAHAYDGGRELAHVLTFRHWDQS